MGVQEEMMMMRKGPWTEQEDVQLVLYVNLFGDRRWDFIAKVSGLKRTGKSCRLRWVNYLHPGLKRCKMTPHEERLVLDLHAKWGNRWSRIARKLPGRTDNEIKNYWRTHMRKKAQERKRAISPSNSSSPSSSSSSSASNNPMVATMPVAETKERSFYDTGGVVDPRGKKVEEKEGDGCYSMEEIWKDISTTLSSEDESMMKLAASTERACNFSGQPLMASPIWDYCPDWLWMMEEDESKMTVPKTTDQFHFFNDQDTMFLTG